MKIYLYHVLAPIYGYYYTGGFHADSVVKNMPPNAGATRDTGSNPGLGRSSGIGNGNQPNIVVWEISCKVKPGRLQSMGFQRVDMTEQLNVYP